MNKQTIMLRQILLIIGASVVVSACEDNSNRGLAALRLPPCSSENSIFAEKPYKEWKDLYHEQVDKVIEAHMQAMNESGQKPLQCTKADQNALIPATDALKEVAAMIPAWKDRISELKETDMQAVLLEFLRVYECSLDENILFLPVNLTIDDAEQRGAFTDDMTAIRTASAEEKTLSRETLNRTLSLVSGFDRLQPLTLDIECLKRSSLDLRNTLGIASDVSSCLPRIWDAKGSLRDLKE